MKAPCTNLCQISMGAGRIETHLPANEQRYREIPGQPATTTNKHRHDHHQGMTPPHHPAPPATTTTTPTSKQQEQQKLAVTMGWWSWSWCWCYVKFCGCVLGCCCYDMPGTWYCCVYSSTVVNDEALLVYTIILSPDTRFRR